MKSRPGTDLPASLPERAPQAAREPAFLARALLRDHLLSPALRAFLFLPFVRCVLSRSVMSAPRGFMDLARQGSLSMGFSREEHWSGLPLPTPGDLSNPGVKPGLPALQAGYLLFEPPGKTVIFTETSTFSGKWFPFHASEIRSVHSSS